MNFLITINAACNFILYCALSDKYRNTVKSFFVARKPRRQVSHLRWLIRSAWFSMIDKYWSLLINKKFIRIWLFFFSSYIIVYIRIHLLHVFQDVHQRDSRPRVFMTWKLFRRKRVKWIVIRQYQPITMPNVHHYFLQMDQKLLDCLAFPYHNDPHSHPQIF